MDFGSGFLFVAAITVLTAYAAFQQFLRHQRRTMIHRERLAALEKGVELPPLEQEILRGRWNVQRILLFAGLVWISVGHQHLPRARTPSSGRPSISTGDWTVSAIRCGWPSWCATACSGLASGSWVSACRT